MNYKAIIVVGGREYTALLSEELNLSDAVDALDFVRNILLDDGVFSDGPTEALEINCLDKYDSISVVAYLPDVPQPLIAEPQVPEPDINKEYELRELTTVYLGQKMEVLTLIYYNKGRVVLMPTGINSKVAKGYMRDENLYKLMNHIATVTLQLDAKYVDVLIYPGDPETEEAVDYIRDWIKETAAAATYVPKEKNAKAYTGWNERV